MKEISLKTLNKLKEDFPKGSRVELVRMDDPYTTLKAGDKGTVAFIDDIATIHVNWDKGSSLGLIYGEDLFIKLKDWKSAQTLENTVFIMKILCL